LFHAFEEGNAFQISGPSIFGDSEYGPILYLGEYQEGGEDYIMGSSVICTLRQI
jgi:hypothetical protein